MSSVVGCPNMHKTQVAFQVTTLASVTTCSVAFPIRSFVYQLLLYPRTHYLECTFEQRVWNLYQFGTISLSVTSWTEWNEIIYIRAYWIIFHQCHTEPADVWNSAVLRVQFRKKVLANCLMLPCLTFTFCCDPLEILYTALWNCDWFSCYFGAKPILYNVLPK